ncbi:MAG: N-acetylmuramoyl-L-alanine amidase [Phycisphaerales bacterium]|nr:N-acetylmuramoyl-L-alanine amidase [Phycisphaerales bacterium]
MTARNHANGLVATIARLRRPQVVWLSLLVSMSAVAGLLLVLEGPPAPQVRGLALAAPSRAPAAASIEAVFTTRAGLDRQRWQRIVVHHSGAAFGSPATIAAEHEGRNLKGLGYHFVIGNGSGSGDGELYVGYRWLDQLPGAHAAGAESEWNNLHSIGICLVGDGDRRAPTPAQMRRLVELVRALSGELDIPASEVRLHRNLAGTTSPGRFFPETELRAALLTSAR